MLTHKRKVKIAKHLAVIYFVVSHWTDKDWTEFVDCIAYHVVEIAYAVGGQRMMNKVPVLMNELEKRCNDE